MFYERRIVAKGSGPVLSKAASSLFSPRSAACMWVNTFSNTPVSVISLGLHAVVIVVSRPQ